MTPILLALALAAATPHAPIPLQPMTYADSEATHTVGTGCTWKPKGMPRGHWVISMRKDRGAVKTDGILRRLRPAAEAADLFPFTFDRWTDDTGDTIAIRTTGRSRWRGTEASDTPASLSITRAGEERSWTGTLNCGS